MIDLSMLQNIRLSPRPVISRAVGLGLMKPNYAFAGTRVTLEGTENLPSHPVLFAMNHTDRYNYWPFQLQLWRQAHRFTATWVKGKYYEHPLMSKFLRLNNSIPAVSRGYLITKDFLHTMKRKPTESEYRLLRNLVDHFFEHRTSDLQASPQVIPEPLLEEPRTMLGRPFNPSEETYEQAICSLYSQMMEKFLSLHHDAFEKNLDVLILPQGTRSIRLSAGHSGIAQIALYFKKDIIPVGCSGSDKVFPGNSPIAKKGHIQLRIGKPLFYADMKAYVPESPFVPFRADAEKSHKKKFQDLTDVVMNRINMLVDPPYQFSQDKTSDGTKGTQRFL